MTTRSAAIRSAASRARRIANGGRKIEVILDADYFSDLQWVIDNVRPHTQANAIREALRHAVRTMPALGRGRE